MFALKHPEIPHITYAPAFSTKFDVKKVLNRNISIILFSFNIFQAAKMPFPNH